MSPGRRTGRIDQRCTSSGRADRWRSITGSPTLVAASGARWTAFRSAMTEIMLIRHAPHDHGGQTLVGRLPGVHVSAPGREELRRLVSALHDVDLAAVYCGPLERTRETAQALASDHEL